MPVTLAPIQDNKALLLRGSGIEEIKPGEYKKSLSDAHPSIWLELPTSTANVTLESPTSGLTHEVSSINPTMTVWQYNSNVGGLPAHLDVENSYENLNSATIKRATLELEGGISLLK